MIRNFADNISAVLRVLALSFIFHKTGGGSRDTTFFPSFLFYYGKLSVKKGQVYSNVKDRWSLLFKWLSYSLLLPLIADGENKSDNTVQLSWPNLFCQLKDACALSATL